MHTDRPTIPPGGFQGFAHRDRLIFDVFADFGGRGLGSTRPGLQDCGLTLVACSSAQGIEGFANDAMFNTTRGHTATVCVLGPIGDRQTYTSINRFIIFGHPSIRSDPKSSGSVTTTTPRTVTDVQR